MEENLKDTGSAPQSGEEVFISIPQEALPAVQAALSRLPQTSKKGHSRRRRPSRIPAIRSGDQTLLPGTVSFRSITQSFSSTIDKQDLLWTEGSPINLITPAGILTVKGETSTENDTLQDYVARHLGPAGLKHLIAFYDVYVLLTGGNDPKKDVTVTAKQLLKRLGLGGHTSDKDEQILLLETARYLSSTWVSLSSARSASK